MEIPSIPPIRTGQITQPITPTTPAGPAGQAEKVTRSFDEILTSLSQTQQNSDDLVSQLASGGNVDIHNVLIAAEENDVNFRVAIAIRDRLVDTYREVMRMAI